MYYPSKREFKNLAKKYNLVPVHREIIADVETPVSAFLKLDKGKFAFLLESAEKAGRLGRYSFLGNSAYLAVTAKNGKTKLSFNGKTESKNVSNPLKVVEEIVSGYRPSPSNIASPFIGGAVGYLGYDAVRYFENIPREAKEDLELYDMFFIFTDALLIFDHLEHKIKIVICAHINSNLDKVYNECVAKIESLVTQLRKPVSLSPLKDGLFTSGVSCESNISKANFLRKVKKAKEYIRAGDVLQVVLSQRFSRDYKANSFDIYRALRTLNPSPYMYYLKFKDIELIGSSPEPLVKVQGRDVITRPIAGTRPRGKNPKEDLKLEKELLSDEKELAEHLMLVDLGRNDLGRVCEKGSVKVSDFMRIEKYSHVMHIVSEVRGKLKKNKNAFDALRAVFPAGTVSGAPKIRAMEIIDELEPTLRGPYAGVVGYFDYLGNLDTCITIRTIVAYGGKVYVQAGAGIVYDSQPEKEYEETKNKARALFGAIKMAEL